MPKKANFTVELGREMASGDRKAVGWQLSGSLLVARLR